MKEVLSKNSKRDRLSMNTIVLQVAELLKSKKARDIIVLDMGTLTTITDYIIICTVSSETQTKALIRYIDEFLHPWQMKLLSRNINVESPWVLLDYNYFVIHIFLPETRSYYQLEKLWSDAEVLYYDSGSIL